MIEASVDSFNCDYTKMIGLFKKIITPITKEEQKSFIDKIAIKNSFILKIYENLNKE